MHFCRKGIGQALALTSGDRDTIARGREVADNDRWVRSARHILRRQEGAADDEDADGLGLGVVDVEDCAGWVAVDELDAKDLGVGEGGLDVDLQVGRLKLAGVFDIVFELLDVFDLV